MSRRIAALVPFYEYDERRGSSAADDAPGRGRRAARGGLHAACRALPRAIRRDDPALTAEVSGRHLRPAVHRRLPRAVPVQPLRAPASQGRHVRAVVGRRDGHRPRRQPLLRPHRLLRRQRLRLRLLQGLHRARPPSACAISARCSAPTTRWSPYNVDAPARDLRPRRSVVPHVRHRGGDAGGAARALPHAAARTWCASAAPITAGGATCSRASAIRCRRARPTRCNDMSEDALRVLRTRRDIACVLVNPLQALHPNAECAGRLVAGRQRPRARISTARPTPSGCGGCARSAPSAASC